MSLSPQISFFYLSFYLLSFYIPFYLLSFYIPFYLLSYYLPYYLTSFYLPFCLSSISSPSFSDAAHQFIVHLIPCADADPLSEKPYVHPTLPKSPPLKEVFRSLNGTDLP